ncbi:tyrosinase family protein [Amycolatopsis sp. K13G38]|uniref:Tyrosinase family protein n=1 Tax=Amycolatopsis acididurans TaxID=2724524 RepID=A0ABX1J3I2_9PSEU|nr:tyrosinase family protein [Amycolatopsis acididurans]NKQ52846.1 tyrosinase family protein [Amycolatopsis acididurans]
MADQIVVRPDVEHADIAALRDAYGKMQALSGTDNRSWIFWADRHGFPSYYCWHHAQEGPGPTQFTYDLFLPWHRAYLSYWEHVARDQHDGAIPPWWDWTSELSHQQGLPAAYTQEQVDGGPNPLFSGPMPDMPDNPARQTSRDPGPPRRLPSAGKVEQVLGLTQYEDFSSQLQDIHDGVHGWVGGDMGVIPTSAFDPVFWAHHCMIDRIWYLWQLRHGVTNIPPRYLSMTLEPFGKTVQQVLDVHELGYEYAVASVSAPGPASANGGA